MRRAWTKPLAAAAVAALVLAGAAEPTARGGDERGAVKAAPITLDVLLERCAKSPGFSAQFVEEKKSALLAVPLRSEGSLHFSPARGLVRHVRSPARGSVMVTDKELLFWDGKKTTRMPTSSAGALEPLARAFSLFLTANRAGLEKDFKITFRGADGGDRWAVELVPTSEALRKLITAIEIEGSGNDVSILRVREANADVATTTFAAVDLARRYTDEELDRIFRVPPG